jgi:hypothetical protein
VKNGKILAQNGGQNLTLRHLALYLTKYITVLYILLVEDDLVIILKEKASSTFTDLNCITY